MAKKDYVEYITNKMLQAGDRELELIYQFVKALMT